ncbi:radical SAM protein [Streptomyces sp. NPDC002742]|jgi:pyruvate formate lyase activating enzyme|uniref:radical SAM protein n=1 Tax=unclassified Streptomyces TaxID=2593676 RepID=UPI003444EE66
METATFATSVQHVDAIERKPLYHYRPDSRAVTLAAPGCSFRCDYCVNHELSQFGRRTEVPWTGRAVSPQAVVLQAQRLGACVALSYSEPSLAIELTLALAEAGAPVGVDVVWKSNGFLTTDAVRRVAPVLAAVNIDIKSVDDVRHRALTGAPAGPVLDTLEALRSAGVWVEASTPLVPGVADSPEDLSAIALRLARIDPGIPWHLARFSPAFRRSGDVPTLPSALAEGVAAGRGAGLRHIYVERALGAAGRATSCPKCDGLVVERDLWKLTANRLRDGACPDCGTRVEGRW